ncbi:MAG: hypothetical protein RJB26_2119 [Pseudomonadota bacterium]
MARLGNTLGGRVLIGVLAVHFLLLPPLFLGLLRIVEDGEGRVFINEVRSYANFIGDELERDDSTLDAAERQNVLDGIVLSGHALYAELEGKQKTVSRAFESEGLVFRGDDFAIHSGNDEVYYLSKPLSIDGRTEILRLGFDERAVLDAAENARTRIWYVLAAYLLVSTLGAVLLIRRLTRPLNELREASRKVSGGAFDRPLSTTSTLHEVRELTQDLEFMRDRLATANVQLVREIAERESSEQTRHKLEQQLRQQQKLRELGTLAGGIAHEFNNVLVPILLYTESAIDELPESSPIREDLQAAHAAAQRARAVVRQILLFARHMDDGERERIDLRTAVGDTVGLVRALMPAQLEVVEDYGSTALPIVGNSALLGQVVMNLCTNARQAMRERGGRLLVRTWAGPGPSGAMKANLSVSDEGHGMSAEVASRIFEPFFTTRPVGEGTGLGLPVVHGIIESLRGTITVESTPGVGSTFTVRFPLADDPVLAAPSQQGAET